MTERTIRMTAKDLAGSYYEEERSERFRKFWPDRKQFTIRNWPLFVTMAKTILIAMLNDKNTAQSVKDGIYDAIVEENTKNVNVKGVKVGRGVLNLNPVHPGKLEEKLFWRD